MARIDELNKALQSLLSSSGDIEGSAIVSEDGLIIASALQQGIEEGRVAAMSSAMLSIGDRIGMELKRGKLEQIFVKGEFGFIVLMHAGSHAVLVALARKEAKLGLLFLDMQRTADEVKKILG